MSHSNLAARGPARSLAQLISRSIAVALATVAVALGSSHAAAAPTEAPQPPVMRLGTDVQPLAYALEATIVPTSPTFEGHVDIDLKIAKPMDFFWMHGTRLDVRRVVLTVAGKPVAATAVAARDNFIGIQLAQKVPAGAARLSIDYAGKFSHNDTEGFFVQKDLGEWYAFSQFEAPYARQAIPCFDEPQWKTPWTVTLKVRNGDTAVSNTPQVSEQDAGDGMKRVRFATSKPLPTYLVAIAVGPFDVVDGGKAGANHTQLRYIVPKGRADQVAFARESTPRLLEILEDYFGRPYPFEKLDHLGIPITVGFGAMENPGLITYSVGIMATPRGRPIDENERKDWVLTAGHEMAHQWFGDMVTMTWWNDLWLNESFATWMEAKVERAYRPDWDATGAAEEGRMRAVRTDRLSRTRRVREPVETEDDLGNVFDGITYQKGGALLSMFETWLGEERFRTGVRDYLGRHAYGSATARDFFASIAKSDPQVASAFASFVEQAGVPVLDFELDCSGAQPAVRVRQSRFDPLGKSASPQQWTLPACVRAAGAAKPVCAMVTGAQSRIELGGASCPAWVLPNPAGTGYYLSRTGGAGTRVLPPAGLSREEAVAFLNDQSLLAGSGLLRTQELLAIVAPFTRDTRLEVVEAAARAVEKLHPAWFEGSKQRAIGGWVMEHFGARAKEVGWVPAAGESDAVRNLREPLLLLVADIGGDAQLRASARSLALDWLAGNRATLGEAAPIVLRIAAYDADRALVDAMLAAIAKAEDSTTRIVIYNALGRVRDPALRTAMFEHALAPGVELRESRIIYNAAADEPASTAALLQFMQAHIGEIAKRLPAEAMARVPTDLGNLCSAQDRATAEAMFKAVAPPPPGLERNVALMLETADICVKARGQQ